MTRTAQSTTYANVVRVQGNILLRAYPDSQSAPVLVEMTPTEAIGFAIDLLNKARVEMEMAESRAR